MYGAFQLEKSKLYRSDQFKKQLRCLIKAFALLFAPCDSTFFFTDLFFQIENSKGLTINIKKANPKYNFI